MKPKTKQIHNCRQVNDDLSIIKLLSLSTRRALTTCYLPSLFSILE